MEYKQENFEIFVQSQKHNVLIWFGLVGKNTISVMKSVVYIGREKYLELAFDWNLVRKQGFITLGPKNVMEYEETRRRVEDRQKSQPEKNEGSFEKHVVYLSPLDTTHHLVDRESFFVRGFTFGRQMPIVSCGKKSHAVGLPPLCKPNCVYF